MRDEDKAKRDAWPGDRGLYDYVARQFAAILADADDEPRHRQNRQPMPPDADYASRRVTGVVPEPAEELQELFSSDSR